MEAMNKNGMILTGTEIQARRIDLTPPLHPATESLLRFFDYAHLPEHLQWVSQPFHDLAYDLAYNFELSGAELTAGLRKLLEAKDCAVRAAVS